MLSKLEEFTEGILKKGQASFLAWFFVIFLGTLAVLAAFGFLPSELQVESNGNNFVEEGKHLLDNVAPIEAPVVIPKKTGQTYGLLPGRLIIPSIKVDAVVDNPMSTSTKSLDYELTKGPVRYPGSGTVGSGNMFIFGHSTGWSVVQNKAYKVFNEIKTLNKGDPIYVEANGKTYTYMVREVTEVNKNDTLINFDTTNNMLTLSTCDSFGAKTDRYVVTADFVSGN